MSPKKNIAVLVTTLENYISYREYLLKKDYTGLAESTQEDIISLGYQIQHEIDSLGENVEELEQLHHDIYSEYITMQSKFTPFHSEIYEAALMKIRLMIDTIHSKNQ